MSVWKVGIIGCGGISHVHSDFYSNQDRVEVVALCDILPERAEKRKKQFFPNAKIYTDYNELLKDNEIDSVDICTPNDLHSEIAVAAFAAGKHVITEKPDAVSVEEVLRMNKAAEEAGKKLFVMRNNRFVECSCYAKDFIDAGGLGEVYCGRCGWQRRRGIPGKGGWFTTKARSGGGPLIDLGVHMIDLAMYFMGNPTPVAVTGAVYNKFADNDIIDSENSHFGDRESDGVFDVEDLAMGMIRFDNGAVLQLEFSWASNIERENRFVELRGTKAGLKWQDGVVTIFGEQNGRLVNIESPNVDNEKGHQKALKHYYDCLIDGIEPVFVPQQGIDMIKILCAIYKSAETGREVIL